MKTPIKARVQPHYISNSYPTACLSYKERVLSGEKAYRAYHVPLKVAEVLHHPLCRQACSPRPHDTYYWRCTFLFLLLPHGSQLIGTKVAGGLTLTLRAVAPMKGVGLQFLNSPQVLHQGRRIVQGGGEGALVVLSGLQAGKVMGEVTR